MRYILHVEVRAYLKTINFSSGGGFGEPKLANVEKECTDFWLKGHVAKESGFVERLRKVVDGCGEGAFIGCV